MSWRPKALEELQYSARQRNYSIHASLNESQILWLTVTDTISQTSYKQQFALVHFKHMYQCKKLSMHDIAKIVIGAISDPTHAQSRCKIIEYDNWLYLTIDNGSKLPSFALPKVMDIPAHPLAQQTINNNTNRRITHHGGATNAKFSTSNSNPNPSVSHHQSHDTFADRQKQRSRALTQLPPPVTLSMLTNYGVMDTSTSTKGMNIDETDDDESDTEQEDEDSKKEVLTQPKSGGFASGLRRRLRGGLNRAKSGRAIPKRPARPKAKSTSARPPPPPRRAKSVYTAPRSINNHNNNNNGNVTKNKNNNKHGYGLDVKSKNDNDIDMEANEKLLKVYNDYVREKGEKPGNTFDMINYIQFNGITGINFRQIGKFLMTHKQ